MNKIEKQVTITFNATMGQLYQVTNFYRETKGLYIYFYNVRKIDNNKVSVTMSYIAAPFMIDMMTTKGYAIVNE